VLALARRPSELAPPQRQLKSLCKVDLKDISGRDVFQLAIVDLPTRFVELQDARYLALFWNHAFRPRWSMQFYATAGLTPTSPNYGVGIGGMFRLN